ncbi:MAG: RNA degradosome polyphosphate kinase [Chloroflexi bacterium]|nr:RNA degradosome polyphosphate kinase [Chloroflexota bacterium]
MAVSIHPRMATSRRVAAPSAEDRAARYINRELSTLEFNARILELAEDASTPVLERVKFAAIVAGNLDEFFGVRVAGLQEQAGSQLGSRSPDGMTAAEQLESIRARVGELTERHARAFGGSLRRRLARDRVAVLRWRQLNEAQRATLTATFHERVFPVLTPLAVDPGHPFPYISNLSLNLAVIVADTPEGQRRFARVKVPPLLPRFLSPSDDARVFVPLEDVIAANLGPLFPGMKILESSSFRVTRSIDLDLDDDDAEDLLEALEDRLRSRRFSPAVRLEVERRTSAQVLSLLMRELQLTERDVYRLPAPLGLADLWHLYALDRPDLKDAPLAAVTPAALAATDEHPADIFGALADHDVLVHHPYDSFSTSVQAFVEAAAADPSVLAIKQTLYRTSGDSPVVDALVDAAAAGKQVVVLVEIKARGDEPANIVWARMLERAGCHVVYGLVGLKTHAKLCLVVRQEGAGIRRYVHIGTGNYNPTTARTYEDLGLLTADETLTADVNHLFNLLTGYSRRSEYERLIVAPINMRRRVIEMIEREARLSTPEAPGRIMWKLNGLVDEAVVDALYDASRAGVQIDLVVRAICGLRPGVPGLSETIRVRSILGRFLEHSRVYWFGNGGDPEVWIGSADMMHRNLDRRVETLVRVDDPGIKVRLAEILELAMAERAGAWTMTADGQWLRAQASTNGDGPPLSIQAQLQRPPASA